MSRERIDPPQDEGEALARLRSAVIPHAILAVMRRLAEHGHAAVLVGGAVRDVLCGAEAGDFDLATSATPDEVVGLFARTIPTGLQHGTVTVLSGRGEAREAVEVTTFRGEGAYEDGRRPSEVRFLRELEGDLARRDLTINAFAWDPIAERFTDAFGGLADLRAGIVRAVGDARERFAEDGLRAIRAVRFAAVLGFVLEAATAAAIAESLDVFDRVSRERVRVELFKLLAAEKPSLGLRPMVETRLWSRVLGNPDPARREDAIAAVDRLPCDPVLRLARLLRALADPAASERVVDALKPSRAERARTLLLVGTAAADLAHVNTPEGIRRAVAKIGRERLDDVLALDEAEPARRKQFESALAGAALTIRELALGGEALVAAGIAKPGPELGRLLAGLLDHVLEDPARNVPESLLARATELAGPPA